MTDTTMSEAEAQPTPSEAVDAETTAMGDAYDRAMAAREEAEFPESDEGPARDEQGRFVSAREDAEGAEEAPAEAEDDAEEVETAEAEDDAQTGGTEPLAHLPEAIKAAWKDMSEDARQAVLDHQSEMDRKFSQQGRMLQAIQPMQSRIMTAIKEYPALANMTPEQVADGAVSLIGMQKRLEADPLNAVWDIANEFGVGEQLRAALTGQQAPEGPAQGGNEQYIAQLQNEIRELKTAVEQGQGSIDDRITAAMEQRETASTVERFASEQPFWADVEPHLPQFINIAREQQPQAAPADILKAAYDMATHAIPEVRAKLGATAQAAPKADPERAERAKRATSINVKSKKTGKERPMTEEELMAAAYDRAMAS